ncbi:NAD(P)H-quinone oxidoreductase [Plasticicumulans sp.]|uniref:NAD(P)H-quinone oxidoreductase n=1 Tax=Plasticicumulans sp. TaxID=2307179 RepID=UPI0039611BD8
MPAVPATMNAVGIRTPGGPEVLQPCTRPVPQPRAGEVLIEVAAAGVNRPDCLQRAGAYPPPPGASDLPGLEVAGCVVAVGAGVDWPAAGEHVCALCNGGGYAGYVAVPAGQCLPVPAGWSDIEAAALPETFFTVWANLFERGRLAAGESVLVHGGAGGIGSTAIRLATAFGATVYASAGSAEKCAACLAAGAARAIDHTREDFVTVVRGETGGRGVDVILDIVGAGYLARHLDLLAPEGRLVLIAGLQGYKAELNLWPLLAKRLSITGSTLRARSDADKAAIATALRARVWPLLDAGRLRPPPPATLALAQAAEAHRRMEANSLIGKLVLLP